MSKIIKYQVTHFKVGETSNFDFGYVRELCEIKKWIAAYALGGKFGSKTFDSKEEAFEFMEKFGEEKRQRMIKNLEENGEDSSHLK